MNFKKIITLSLTGLIGLLFIASALGKFITAENSEQAIQSAKMGISFDTIKYIATIEIMAAVLFLIPRTGILGFSLLTAYLGGAIATHLTHGISVVAPCVFMALLWIVGMIRFNEIGQRLLGKA
jgi:hypothetical protein